LTESFGIVAPLWYLDLVDEFAERDVAEVEPSTTVLRDLNENCRKNGTCECEWQDSFWAIGGDGEGGIYFFDSTEDNSHIYYIDHEYPPYEIEGRGRPLLPNELRGEIYEGIRAVEEYCRELREKIANRKWWQFWIPRRIPAWAREETDAADVL